MITSDEAIAPDNIRAAGAVHFSAMLDAMQVYDVVDRLVELAMLGHLPLHRSASTHLLDRYVRSASDRLSAAERRAFYARAVGIVGGTTGAEPNRAFDELWLRFIASVSELARSGAGQDAVRERATALALNLSTHGQGLAAVALSLKNDVSQLLEVLAIEEFRTAFAARDTWQLVDRVALQELGQRPAIVRRKTMAEAGARIFAWLAMRSRTLSSGGDALDLATIANQQHSINPTTTPTDFDLVDACEAWLAVIGIDEPEPSEPARPSATPEIREAVETLFSRSAAFAQLSPVMQTAVARDTARVADYLAVMESPAVFKEFIDEVDFPQFVQDLISGVFAAIVDSSIRQMESYRDLMEAVAASVDDFRNPSTSVRDAITRLCDAWPPLCARADTATTASERSPYANRPPDLPPALDTLGAGVWRRLASSRQQLLATMVLTGVQRIATS